MKELSFYLFLCHSLQSGAVWLGIMWLKPVGIIGMQQVLDCKFPMNSWFPCPASGTGSQLQMGREILAQGMAFQNKASSKQWEGMSVQEKHPQSTQKKAWVCSPAMNWNQNTPNPEHLTSTPEWDTGGCWFHLGVNSGATEAQVGLANYYKFMLKKDFGAAFICTILQINSILGKPQKFLTHIVVSSLCSLSYQSPSAQSWGYI